jgi:hypothetical protein
MMIPIINMYNGLEKELDLERKGVRRTRRWIGDDSRVIDDGWYQGNQTLISLRKSDPGKVSQAQKTMHGHDANRSILVRLFYLLRNRRQPAMNISE